jgi:pimeloyl-ACP methyl ester carboxylesterase
MSVPQTHHGLLKIREGEGDRAAVVLHGIRQRREDLRAFAMEVGNQLPSAYSLYLYGYNHTAGLEYNGEKLLKLINTGIAAGRIDLIGYSMGGLVARLAATHVWPSRIHTVVTVATPNRGSISNAELTVLGQFGRSIFQMISPLAPRTEGIKDLTRVVPIMQNRRNRMKEELAGSGRLTSAQRRYASVPALFYNSDRTEFEFGPSIAISGAQALIKFTGLRLKLVNMRKPHDGIVTENSNRLDKSETTDFSEIHLTSNAENGNPAICHAVVDTCKNQDHSSILSDANVAHLVASLISNDDWRQVRKMSGILDIGARIYPFDFR